jgi:hypothetical protein
MGRRSVSRVASRSHLVSMLAARPNANFSCFASFSSVPQTITTGDLYLLFETYGRITSIHFLESQVIPDRKASHRSPSPPPGRKLDLIVYKDHNCRFDEMEDLDVDAERTVAVSG